MGEVASNHVTQMVRLEDLHDHNHMCPGKCVKVVPFEEYERLRAALEEARGWDWLTYPEAIPPEVVIQCGGPEPTGA